MTLSFFRKTQDVFQNANNAKNKCIKKPMQNVKTGSNDYGIMYLIGILNSTTFIYPFDFAFIVGSSLVIK